MGHKNSSLGRRSFNSIRIAKQVFIWRNSEWPQTPHVSPYFPHVFKWRMLTFHWWDPGSSHVPRAVSSSVCGSSVSMWLVLTVVSAAAEVTESWWWCSDSSWWGFLFFFFRGWKGLEVRENGWEILVSWLQLIYHTHEEQKARRVALLLLASIGVNHWGDRPLVWLSITVYCSKLHYHCSLKMMEK